MATSIRPSPVMSILISGAVFKFAVLFTRVMYNFTDPQEIDSR